MGRGVFAAVVAFLHVLLGIVPGAAGVGQEDGQHKARTQAAGQQTNHARRTQQQAHNHGNHNGQQGRENHLVLGRLGGDAHAGSVVRALLAFQDTRYLAELPAHLNHHFGSGAPHGLHGESAEQEGHHGAHEYAHQHLGVHQGDVVHLYNVRNAGVHGVYRASANLQDMASHMLQANLEFLDVGSQESQGSKRGGTDGKALAGSGRGVAQGIQHVGLFAHGRIQFAHLRVAAGIVCNGAVSICGQGDSQRREHAHRRDGDAVQAQAQGLCGEHEVRGKAIGQEDGGANGDYGNGR